MKKKNLLVISAAVGLCIAAVMLLAGSMGVYAERSGTAEFAPEIAESETSDMLTEILSEGSKEEEEGTLSEEELVELWEQMYAVYSGTEKFQQEQKERQSLADVRVKEMKELLEEQTKDLSLEDARLKAQEAGMIFLKEINRLYPKDVLEGLQLNRMWLIGDIGYDNQSYLEWQGYLENGKDITDENYVSYEIEVDAISGQIMMFQKFHPYSKDKDYSGITWTDEEIAEHAKELIAKYHLADVEELDWSDPELYNGTEGLEDLQKDLEEDASAAMNNLMIFRKDEQRYFLFSTDWETGEISSYVWAGRHLPK